MEQTGLLISSVYYKVLRQYYYALLCYLAAAAAASFFRSLLIDPESVCDDRKKSRMSKCGLLKYETRNSAKRHRVKIMVMDTAKVRN